MPAVPDGPRRTDVWAALGALAKRYCLDGDAIARLARLLELVASDPHAPTTVRDPRRAVDVHLADSLVALELEPVRAASQIADLGAGAGFPGLPLAIALPHADVALIESNGRKCAFLERAIEAAGVANARPVDARAEEWSDGIGRCDLVTARALAAPAVIAEYAAPLLRIGGVVVAWRGRREPDAEGAGALAAAELGLRVEEPVRVRPYAGAEHRYLHLMTKQTETPPRFPRRAGMALKRPLGQRASDRARR
jgi:16S rRNA (guanine527-N7)-methyltransferase